MRVNEIKDKITFYVDAMLQSGFELGWNSVLEELEQKSDREWNEGRTKTAEVIREAVKELRAGE